MAPQATVLEDDAKEEVILRLPSPVPTDPMFLAKKKILLERDLLLAFPIPTSNEEANDDLFVDGVLKVARILNIDEAELYFMEDDDEGPFSPRNEIEALNLIFSLLNIVLTTIEEENKIAVVMGLKEIILKKLEFSSVEEEYLKLGTPCERNAELKLFNWAAEKGFRNRLNVAAFDGIGRGLTPVEDITAGEILLDIPMQFLINEDIAMKSEAFGALKEIEEISGETVALLWTIKEWENTRSEFAPYFESLPQKFNTGLSFGLSGLKALEGTLMFEEILQVKEHLRTQFDFLTAKISESVPNLLDENLFTWDRYLQACELWYSNSLKVVFPDGNVKTCLVPIAGLMNHGLYPHVTHYNKIDPQSLSLKISAARPCKAGQQCFLHYGTFPSSHFLTFYGFVPHSVTPYDTIPVDLDLSDAPERLAFISKMGLSLSHIVRGSWFSSSRISPYGLPTRLLATLRLVFLEDDEANELQDFSRNVQISIENEIQVVECLSSILKPMLDSVQESSRCTDIEDNDSWEVALAARFKEHQIQVLNSICSSCSSYLKDLTCNL